MKRPTDEIIDNALYGLASGEDASLVAKWLATDEGQEYLSQRIDEHFLNMKDGFEEIQVPHTIPSEKIWKKIETRTFTKQSKRHFVLKIAAVLIPLFFVAGFLGIFMNNNQLSEYAEIYVPKGKSTELILDDGTKVYLNADSKLLYPEKFTASSRKVSLDGEAYFEVTADKKHPFVVELPNGAAIEVLGTAFNVQAYSKDEDINVALDHGKINLVSASNKKHELLPQQKLVYKKSTENVFIAKDENTEADSAWKDGYIVFNDTPLAEVIKTLNRVYNVEFKIQDKAALTYSYTLTTKKIPLKQLLMDFEKISPVKFTLKEDTVIVTMKQKN